MSHRSRSGWEAMLLGFVGGLAGLSAFLFTVQAIRPEPIHGAGMVVDRLSASMSFLVAFVGVITFRFSQRYLHGEAQRRAFLSRLALTVGAAYVLMLSNHLLLLFLAWSLTSLGLHTLLTHYPDRPEALPPARKKFLISRLGDLALLAAIALVWGHWGTLDLSQLLRTVSTHGQDDWHALWAVGVLVATAALTKSAQFPFHSWLPETMESPTPVSALMHAGIINAGGALLLRFAPLIVQVPPALLLLSAVGTVTMFMGTLVMWSQVKVKRTLAWSTVSQMGFMMVQCGLAAFPAASLHILGHGFYKAWSFLRSGDLPRLTKRSTPASPARVLVLAALGTTWSVPALAQAARTTGFEPWETPGELALAAVVALTIGQLWVALLRAPAGNGFPVWRIAAALVGSYVAALAAFGLYCGAGDFLAPVLGEMSVQAGPWAWAAAILPLVAIVLLTILQPLLPVLGRHPTGRAFYVHALNGFYFGAIADSFVNWVWQRLGTMRKGVEGA